MQSKYKSKFSQNSVFFLFQTILVVFKTCFSLFASLKTIHRSRKMRRHFPPLLYPVIPVFQALKSPFNIKVITKIRKNIDLKKLMNGHQMAQRKTDNQLIVERQKWNFSLDYGCSPRSQIICNCAAGKAQMVLKLQGHEKSKSLPLFCNHILLPVLCKKMVHFLF